MPKLFMLLLGCKPEGRFTEQHDILFGIANEVKDLKSDIIASWPEAKGKMHVDAWRVVENVNGYAVEIAENIQTEETARLFFINLGGYKRNEFDEFHYKMIIAAKDKGEAVQIAKQSAFYKHTQFDGATSHIDDKYGIDVDDAFEIADVLPAEVKQKYSIQLRPAVALKEDEMHLGYFKLDKL